MNYDNSDDKGDEGKLSTNGNLGWVFFGSPDISVYFLEKMLSLGIKPSLVVTNPDRKVGRKQILTESAVALWAAKNKVEVIKPEVLDEEFLMKLKSGNFDFSFVLAYGKILKEDVLNVSRLGTLNLHPSLLPKYRGPSPIMSAILDDQKNTGFSIMILDKKMDHGPTLMQQKVEVKEWKKNDEMEKTMAEMGAESFAEILHDFAAGKVVPQEQDHEQATFCKKYTKEDMQLHFPLESRENFLKYCAFPKPFYINEDGKRNVVTEAVWEENQFTIEKIIPEGKKERYLND